MKVGVKTNFGRLAKIYFKFVRWIDVDILSEAFINFYGGILDILVLNFGILSQNIHHCRVFP